MKVLSKDELKSKVKRKNIGLSILGLINVLLIISLIRQTKATFKKFGETVSNSIDKSLSKPIEIDIKTNPKPQSS